MPSALAASLPEEHLSCGLGECLLQGCELRARTQASCLGKKTGEDVSGKLPPCWNRAGLPGVEAGGCLSEEGSWAQLLTRVPREGGELYVKAMLVLGSSITNHIFS